MSKYRKFLPQLGGELFIADGGIETTLVFHEGQDLPYFAAFDLLKSEAGYAALQKYFRTYAELAARLKVGLVLESATWRANPDWAMKLNYGRAALAEANRKAVQMLDDLRSEFEGRISKFVVSGCVGPRGDGYIADRSMSASEAEDYHSEQVQSFADSAADLVSGITLNYAEEAVGLVRAARQAEMPVVAAFTVETDGRLPTGQTLGDAINQVDDATSGYPSYYMINCAHPSHFTASFDAGAPWLDRVRGLRANASRMSHAELNDAPELDAGDPDELGREYASLMQNQLKRLSVVGGCCGTDHRHVERMAVECLSVIGKAS